MDKIADIFIEVLKGHPRILGAAMGLALHPVFSWILR